MTRVTILILSLLLPWCSRSTVEVHRATRKSI